MFLEWLIHTIRTFAMPVVFLSSLYTVLGIGFLFLSPTVGAVLLGTGIAIAGLFTALAYRSYLQEEASRRTRKSSDSLSGAPGR